MGTAGQDEVDRALIDRINAGGPDGERAFGELYNRHKGWAMSVARRMAGDAGDVVQDSFISFLRQFPGFELTSALRTYLYAVIRNRARDQRCKDSRLRLVGDVSDAGPIAGGGSGGTDRGGPDSDGQHARTAGLREAVAALPEAQREILILRIVDGFSVRDVAGALEIPEGTVKSRLHLAIKALREDPRTREYFE